MAIVLSLLAGFLAGYLVSRLTSALTGGGVIVRAIISAQIQALRMLSSTINHYYKIRHWHDKVAWSIDDAQKKLKESIQREGGVEVKLPDGQSTFVELTEEDIEEVSENWADSRVQELKVIWNEIEHEETEWRNQSALIVKASMMPYQHLVDWDNWTEAMDYLARYELVLLRKLTNNVEDVK